MITNAMGIIFCNSNDAELNELTSIRAVGSVPFGGRYRLVDFALSAFVNAGISKVGLITKQNFKSLADHIGSGRSWDLARKNGGITMLTPFAVSGSGVFKDKIDALSGSINYLEHAREDYVVVGNANLVSTFSLEDMINEHIKLGADITLAYQKGAQTASYITMNDKVATAFTKKPVDNEENGYLEAFVISRELLIDLVKEAATHNYTDLTVDIFHRKAGKLKICCYEVCEYAKLIDNVKEFFEVNMDLLKKDVRKALFGTDNPIYTKVRDEMPCKYGFNSKVENSLIGEGCVIEGEVKNSIIFRGVKVGKGAKVENCIIMQSGVVGENTQLEYIIADKNVTFKDERTLMGCRSFPMVIGKGITV